MIEETTWLCWDGEPKSLPDGRVVRSRLLHRGQSHPPGAVFERPESDAEKLVENLEHCREATDAEIKEHKASLSAPPPPPPHEKQASEIDWLKGQLRARDERIATLEAIARGKSQSPEINALKGKLDAAEDRVGALGDELREANADLDKAEAELKAFKRPTGGAVKSKR